MADPTAEELSDIVAEAVDVAIALARRDGQRREGPPVPVGLRPFLRFSRFPARARSAVIVALEQDEGFRERVADSVSEKDVGRLPWIFLTRPQGWEEELAAAAENAAEERQRDEAQRREQAAERRLEQATDAARDAKAERDEALAERDELAERLEQVSARGEQLRALAEDLEQQKSRAVRHLKETEALAATRLDDLRGARSRLEELESALAERDRASEQGDSPAGGPSTGTRAADPAVTDSAATDPPVTDPAVTDSAVTEASVPDSSGHEPVAALDPALVQSLLEEISRAASHAVGLGTALEHVAGALAAATPKPAGSDQSSSGHTGPNGGPSGAHTPASTAAPGRPAARPAERNRPSERSGQRRHAMRLRGGVVEDTAEAVQQLLAVDGLVAIVDGYNVTMEGWPGLDSVHQRRSLISGLGALQTRAAAAIHVVFDGVEDGSRVAGRAALPVRVHFSPADVEADDLILEMVSNLDRHVPVLVVSTDRRVADGARALGANTARSSTLLEALRP